MGQTIKVSIADLYPDKDNPRLAEVAKSHRDALRAILEEQGDKKILGMARDIVAMGLSPSDLAIVIQEEDKSYTVLEGNRRTVTLQVLHNPSLAEGIFSKVSMSELRELSEEFKSNPIEKILVYQADSREDANHWIRLKHSGVLSGEGIDSWGATEKARFEERQGKKQPHLQALDWVIKLGKLSTKAKNHIQDVATSTLERILNDPTVRARLGVKIIDDDFIADPTNSTSVNGLTQIVEDLATRSIKVKDVFLKSDRKKYLDKIIGPVAPKKAPATALKTKAKKSMKRSSARKTLIPNTCALNIPHHRISDLAVELQELSVDDYPNAVGVLFRVFLELSVDHYLEGRSLVRKTGGNPISEADKLFKKIEVVADDLENNKVMSTHELRAVRNLEQPGYKFESHSNMHAFVHNKSFQPIPGDLKLMWDNLQLFFEKIWP